MGSLQKIIDKFRNSNWFQKDNLIILVLAGILLVVITLPLEKDNGSPKERKADNQMDINVGEVSLTAQEEQYAGLYEYSEKMEQKLEKVLESMKGVGKVKVMITLEASEEQVVEKDEELQRNNTTENDGEGGNRVLYETDTKETTIYSKDGTRESPYVTKVILPRISGVLVIAEGAGTGTVSKNITEIVQALFDIEAHKVKVVPMEQK